MAMSDDIQNGQEATEQESAGTQKTDTVQKRIDNLVAQKNAALAELEQLKATQRANEEKLLVEQGKYKELYESSLLELEPLRQAKAELEQHRVDLEQRNKERLALIPEDKRALIPEIDDPVKLGKWLDRSLSLITETKPQAPRIDAGAGAARPQNALKLTDEERTFARMAGMSEELYAANKAQRGEAIDIDKLRERKKE